MNKTFKTIKYSLVECFEKPTSKSGFLKAQKVAIVGDSIARTTLIKNKVFTEREIDKLVRSKLLIPIKYRSKVYFKKRDVFKALGLSE